MVAAGPSERLMSKMVKHENSWMARKATVKAMKAVMMLFFSLMTVHFSTCQKRLILKCFILQVLSLRR